MATRIGALKPGGRFQLTTDPNKNVWEKTDDPSGALVDIECACVKGPFKSDEPYYFHCSEPVIKVR